MRQLEAKEFLAYVLRYYREHGSTELIQSKIGDVIRLYGRGEMSVLDMTKVFGGDEELVRAWKEVQRELFVI